MATMHTEQQLKRGGNHAKGPALVRRNHSANRFDLERPVIQVRARDFNGCRSASASFNAARDARKVTRAASAVPVCYEATCGG